MMMPMLAARFSPKFVALVAAVFALLPALARAETASSLPKGYTSDDDAPAAQTAAAAQPAMDTQPAPAAEAPPSADATAQYSDTDPSALTDFREPLSPYGTWVDDPQYGTIWVPDSNTVGSDFAPYQTAGHWSTDDSGEWLWVSDYNWGYIPFHYGRWTWIGGRGWGWIPGRTYAPAWVVWRTGDYGYIGWAPYPPSWYWSGGFAVGFRTVPHAAFAFCPTGHVFAPHLAGFVVHDRATIQAAAAHTAPYHVAQARVGAGVGGGRSPDAAHANYLPASPSLKDAHVPTSAAPSSHTHADSRALALSKPSSSGRANAAAARSASSARPAGAASGASAATTGASWGSRHGISRPEGAAMLNETRHGDAMLHSASASRGSVGYPSRSSTSFRSSSPSYGGSPSYRSAPSYSRSSPSYSSPSPYRAGGGSAPGWSAPASRAAPPAYHPSAAPSHFQSYGTSRSSGFSAPRSSPSFHSSGGGSSFHSSGGGFHGGGGGFHGGGGHHR